MEKLTEQLCFRISKDMLKEIDEIIDKTPYYKNRSDFQNDAARRLILKFKGIDLDVMDVIEDELQKRKANRKE